ncbi:hypothetical protein ACFE04_016225 [Oxalis oulophora]
MGKELMINFDYDQLVHFDDDEAEDALSLCDLAMDGDDDKDDDSKFEETSSSSFDQQDFFEFSSSGEISSSDNIIFCGKLISYKDDQISYKPNKLRSKSQQTRQVNKTWSMPFSSGKYNKKIRLYSAKKVSIIATQVKSSSSMWPFGVGISPVEMEFKDISRRSMSRSNDEKENESDEKRSRHSCLWGVLSVLMFKKKAYRYTQ